MAEESRDLQDNPESAVLAHRNGGVLRLPILAIEKPWRYRDGLPGLPFSADFLEVSCDVFS